VVALLYHQHNKRVGIRLARTPHPLEIFRPGQTELSLHPLLKNHLLPANLFNVFVGLYRQLMTTAQAAALEHSAPISRGHAFAEAMHANTAANFGLIRSLWHSFFPRFKNNCLYGILTLFDYITRHDIIP